MAQEKAKMTIHQETMSAIFVIVLLSVFVLVNLLYEFIMPLYIVVLLGAAISFVYPRSGLSAIIFLNMVFERFFTLSPIYIGRNEYKFYPLDALLIAILLSSIFIFIKDRKEKILKFIRADYFLLGFVVLNLAWFFLSVFVFRSDSYLSFSALKNYGFYSLLYFVTFILIRTREDLERLYKFFLGGAVVIIGFIIFGIINGGGLWTQYTPLSTSGIRTLAFTHGLFIALSLIPALMYVIFKRAGIYKKYFYLLITIWIIGIIGTLMRHLWVSLAVTLVILYIFLPKNIKTNFRILSNNLAVGGVTIICFAIYLAMIFPQSNIHDYVDRISQTVWERGSSIASASEDESFAWRKLVWTGAYGEYKNDPALGIGTGKTVYVETEKYRDFVEIRNIHNSYLTLLIQLGILGLGLFLAVAYTTLKNLWRTQGDNDFNYTKFSLLGIILIYLFSLPFQPYLETNLLAIFFWISLGLARNMTDAKLRKISRDS